MITAADVREVAMSLPRTEEHLIRDYIKFRVGKIVYASVSPDETTLGFGFPKAERSALADGTADKLDPLVNSHTLTGQIPGARLVLYPDAGHTFLFQDEAALVPVIGSFLGDS